MKKFGGSKNVAISVKLDMLEVMGSAVVDKDMFCVHWTMKGLRGRENSGDTENVRAVISGSEAYPVARFPDVFAGSVHARPRKDGEGYEAMELDLRVTQPALHKKDDKVLGKTILNIFEKVPTLTNGQPHKAEQTCPLVKDGTACVAVKITLLIGDEVPESNEIEPASPSQAEPEPAPATAPAPAPIVVKSPPATPSKDAGSESGSTLAPESKDETASKRSHRKRRSSNSSAMAAAALKKKEEEMKQKEEEFEEEKKKLNAEIAEKSTEVEDLKKANQHLEARVKELEQSKEQTDVVPNNPIEDKLKEDLRRIQAQNEELNEQKLSLIDDKAASEKKIAELTQALEAAQKELEEAKNQPAAAAAAPSDDSKDKELALLKEQLAELKAELGKKDDSKGAAAPAGNNMVMQAVFAAVGAIVGIIVGYMI